MVKIKVNMNDIYGPTLSKNTLSIVRLCYGPTLLWSDFVIVRLCFGPSYLTAEKSSLNRDSNPGPLAYRASALPTELLRPDILTDSHTPGYPVTYSPSLRNSSPNSN